MPKTILIVEDEKAMLDLLSKQLEREGYRVLRAGDGLSGLNIALKHHPDLILLDIVMPKTNGIDMLKKLRADEWGKQVPVTILSNLSDSAHVFDSLSNDVHDYLVKSDWSLKGILEQVAERLKNS